MGSSGGRGEDWFSAVYAAHYPDIVRYGLRRWLDREASEELTQEVFVVAWRRRAEVPDHCLPWLYGVARRLLANRWRAGRNAPVPVPLREPAATTSPQDSVTALAGIRSALASLGEADQEILRLVGWEHLDLGEVAVVLGCGRGTAAVRLHRARRRLAAALRDTPDLTVVPRPERTWTRG